MTGKPKEPMKNFTKLLKLLSVEHGSKLAYSLVTLLTAGGESIFSDVVFQCPCDHTWNMPYGMVFLLVPALVLLLLGYWLNARTCTQCLKTWCRKKNCCQKKCCQKKCCQKKCCQKKCCQKNCCQKKCYQNCCQNCCSLLQGSQSATAERQCWWVSSEVGVVLVAPLSWVAVALLGGTYYECFASGIDPLARMACHSLKVNCSTPMYNLPCLQDKESDLQDLLKELKSQSQVAGWTLIAVVVIIIMICKCYTLWISTDVITQKEFGEIYRYQEKKIFTEEATKNAIKLANKNIKCFFEGSPPGYNGPTTEDWQHISPSETSISEETYYSPLHRFVSISKEGFKNEATSSV